MTNLKSLVTYKKWKKPETLIEEDKEGFSPYILIDQMEWKPVKYYTNDNCPRATKDDILLVWDWSIGKNATNLEWVIWSTIMCITPKDEVIKEYLHYFIQYAKPIILAHPKWSGLAHINPDIFWNLDLPIYDKDQQKLIVSEIEKQFSRLDEWLSSLMRMRENLKSYRASLLKSAVEWRLTAEWRTEHPDIESADILLDRIRSARREKWMKENPGKKYKEIENVREIKDSIPENWLYTNIWSTLEFLTDYHANWSYEKLKEFVVLLDDPDYAIMIRSTNFEKCDFDVNLKYISEYAYNNLKKTKLFWWEILMSKIWNAGKVYYMPNLCVPCSLAMNLFMIRFDGELLNSKYMYYHLVSIQSKIEISWHIKWVWNPTIDKGAVRSMHINLPPLLEQHRIVEMLEEKFSVIDSLESLVDANIRRAENLKQAILKKAFSGELISE